MSQMQALIGETLGSRYPYKIESVLGSGAMGVVYRATDLNKNRPAAVKVISGDMAKGSKIQQRFEREAKILEQFRHPGIVRFLGYGKYRGTYYIAMEFIEGPTLEKLLQERAPLPWREVVDLGIQVCEALHYAHERGVVHRDLKPSNLMVTADGRVKLTDFGIAKDLDQESLTATGRTLGTAAYMSPEQIRGTPAVSHKTDLYALGVVFYQMLTARAPFEGNSPVVLMHCHLNETVPRPSAKVHEIPRALDDLVVNLMAKMPADRPWDAAAVGLVLTELRDKAERGEPIAMVWPTSGSPSARSTGGGGPGDATAARSKKKARKSSLLSTFTGSMLATRSRASADGADEGGVNPAAVEVAILLAALLLVGGLIVYLVWPPGREYLYKHAETLMASDKRSDWITARDQYLDPLDRRFPDHPYREQTSRWRDRILLEDAESRSGYLGSKDGPKWSQPSNNAERYFVVANSVAEEASRHGDDLAALQQWKELAGKLRPDDKEDRPWYLLALHRADQLEAAIRDRRQIAEGQLRLAEEAIRAGRPERAEAIRSKLVEQYGRYTDLSDLFPSGVGAPGAGAPAAAGPSSPADSRPPESGQGGPGPSTPARPAPPPTTTPGGEAGAPSAPAPPAGNTGPQADRSPGRKDLVD